MIQVHGSRKVRTEFLSRGWYCASDRRMAINAPPRASPLVVRPRSGCVRRVTDTHRDFLDLTLPHLDAVHRVAYNRVRDAGHAEDLVQETYLRAFAAFDGFRGVSARSWLVAICLKRGAFGYAPSAVQAERRPRR